jgi:hypothetical protein
MCKNGGLIVKSGPDTNANGKLDDGEVTQTDEICGGGTSTQLTKTTALPAGDQTCPFGGTTTSSGLDNGANGSVAGDGVLQDGEITATTTTCTNGSQYPGTFVPPGGAAGTNKILLSGGAGSAGGGGPGGPFNAVLGQGTLGGNVAIFKTGKVDASFTPTAVTPHYGAVTFEVTADTTLAVHANSGEATDGEHYLIGGTLYYRQDAANPQITVTGVHVAKNVTLTLPAGGTGIVIGNDFNLEGTLTSGLTAGNRGSVQLNVGRFLAASGSKVALAGAPVAGAAGGNGGSFAVFAQSIFSGAAIDTSGAAGDPGGSFNGGVGGPAVLLAGHHEQGRKRRGRHLRGRDLRSDGDPGRCRHGVGGHHVRRRQRQRRSGRQRRPHHRHLERLAVRARGRHRAVRHRHAERHGRDDHDRRRGAVAARTRESSRGASVAHNPARTRPRTGR